MAVDEERDEMKREGTGEGCQGLLLEETMGEIRGGGASQHEVSARSAISCCHAGNGSQQLLHLLLSTKTGQALLRQGCERHASMSIRQAKALRGEAGERCVHSQPRMQRQVILLLLMLVELMLLMLVLLLLLHVRQGQGGSCRRRRRQVHASASNCGRASR